MPNESQQTTAVIEEIKCFDCEETTTKNQTTKIASGEVVCDTCIENYFECEDCNAYYAENTSFEVEGGNKLVCKDCYNEYTECGCGYIYYNENANWCEPCNTEMCEGCYERHNCEDNQNSSDNFTARKYTNSKTLLSSETGSIIKSPRKFGIELEFYYPRETANDIIEALPIEIGVTDDGSLESCGMEIQTPIASGLAGEKLVKTACRILNTANCRVNGDCGFHLHLDASDLIPADENNSPSGEFHLNALMAFYLVFEDVILSFLPESRRKNRYCKPLKLNYYLQELMNAWSQKSVERLWYRVKEDDTIADIKKDHHHPTRYSGINFHSLFCDNNLEIRYHSGTLNADKILNWIALHQLILDYIKKIDYQIIVNKAPYILELKEKTKLFFELIHAPAQLKKFYHDRIKNFSKEKVETTETNDNNLICAE